MNLSEHIQNRNHFPLEELRKYEDQHVAWSLDGTGILDGDTDPLRLVARLKAEGYDSGQYVLSFVDLADSCSAVWIEGDEGEGARVRVPYMLFVASSPLPSLGGGVVRARPIMPARVYGPSGDTLIDGFLDTASDDVILPAWVAPMIGIDLLPIPEQPIHLAGRPHPVRCRFAPVTLRITDGIQETYEWPGVIGFVPVPMKRGLFGQAGFLQFFDANFRGAARESVLVTNGAFPGRRI